MTNGGIVLANHRAYVRAGEAYARICMRKCAPRTSFEPIFLLIGRSQQTGLA